MIDTHERTSLKCTYIRSFSEPRAGSAAVAELALTEGDAVWASVKATEIEVYPAAHGWCPPDTQVYTSRGVLPIAASAVPRLIAVVVLPTPPF